MANATVKIPFSSSTQGQAIKIGATSTPGTAIHSTGTGLYTTVFDELYLWAMNTQAAATATTVLLTVEFGGATAPDQNIIIPIPGQAGPVPVIDGLMLAGSGSVALTVKAFAATTNVIMVMGYVLRITA